MQQRGFVAVVFVIGCATGGVASQLVVPPARAGTNPTRWEYLCQQGNAQLTTTLNRAGAEGWELATMFSASADVRAHEVQSDAITICYKRAL